MQLYDELIVSLLQRQEVREGRELSTGACWPEDSDHIMILRGDMALELGGELQPGIGCTLVTTDDSLVPEDRITLVGDDLGQLPSGGNVPYARISIVKLRGGRDFQGEDLYNAIRKLEYTRYHFFPKGFMMRVSSSKNKESVRISKEAIANGMSFSHAGSDMIHAFHKNPLVESVHMIYFTGAGKPYADLEQLSRDGERITKTIDHIFKNVIMDCNACSLQKVCEEVEGLKELHFGQQRAQKQQ